jgi:RNA polymerase sigma-70 factor, ECF subfamily
MRAEERIDGATRQRAAMTDESEIKAAWEQKDYDKATSLTLARYGFEVLGFLRAVHSQYDDADEAFALVTERVWTKMPKFEWRCSMRTWLYLLARNASVDIRRSLATGGPRRPQLEHAHESELVARARTETLSLFRTEKRNAFGELCLELAAEDRELLLLRVTRDLSWRDVALVFCVSSGEVTEQQLEREAARLRKRFQLVRTRLRELGRKRGILS